MASGKKRKNVPVTGTGPTASEATRARAPAAKRPNGSGPKVPRSKSGETLPVGRGSAAQVAPEASEPRGSVASRARASRLDRTTEPAKPARAKPTRNPAASKARSRQAIASRAMPAAGAGGSKPVAKAAETSAMEPETAALHQIVADGTSGKEVGETSTGASQGAGTSRKEARPARVEAARPAGDPAVALREEAGHAVAHEMVSRVGKGISNAVARPEKADTAVDLVSMSNDRTPVTKKKNEKKPGADQATALESNQASPQEAAAPVGAATMADTTKPAARAPVAAKVTSTSEAPSTSKASVKPTSAGQGAAEAARAKPATAKPAERTAAMGTKPGKASAGSRLGFKQQEFIVYPAHGVGQIVAIEVQEVAGFKLELFVISFIKDKMILKVPTSKSAMVGMRKLADADVVKKAFDTLGGRARIKRTMWSRRAQEYEAKINSGDLVAIAEVVRDLFRSESQPEQSYSERQLYEAALDRMTREIVVVQKLTETEALRAIEAQLMKGPRRGKTEEAETEEAEIEEAA